MAMLAPFLARRSEVAAPMPLEPPVMRAVLPARVLAAVAAAIVVVFVVGAGVRWVDGKAAVG